MMNLMQSLRQYYAALLIVFATSFGLLGCKSVMTNDTVDYKTTGAVSGPNLSFPPDLITAQADRRYIVQDGTATMSEYNAAVKKSVQHIAKHGVEKGAEHAIAHAVAPHGVQPNAATPVAKPRV